MLSSARRWSSRSGGLPPTHARPTPPRLAGTLKRAVAARALFPPAPFEPEKLSVFFTDRVSRRQQQGTRRYTVTHNDLTGALCLSVDLEFNLSQISGLYNRLLRDEVLAEWCFFPVASLHVFVHVSGQQRWPAPASFRNFIFRRDLHLVLDSFLWADRELLEQHPHLNMAEVFVHFESQHQELHKVERWGVLGNRRSWQPPPESW